MAAFRQPVKLVIGFQIGYMTKKYDQEIVI